MPKQNTVADILKQNRERMKEETTSGQQEP